MKQYIQGLCTRARAWIIYVERYFLGAHFVHHRSAKEQSAIFCVVDNMRDAQSLIDRISASIVVFVCGLPDNAPLVPASEKLSVILRPSNLEMVEPMIKSCLAQLGSFVVVVQDMDALRSVNEHAKATHALNERIHTLAFSHVALRLKYLMVNHNQSLILLHDEAACFGKKKSALLRRFYAFTCTGGDKNI